MPKKGLQKRFGLIRDTREVEVPFGPGIFFTLRRPSHPAVVEWNAEQSKNNPLVALFNREAQKEQARLMFAGKGTKVDQAALAERVFSRDDIEIESIGNYERLARERAAIFVEGWRGMDDENGADLPYSREELLDLLRAPELLPEDAPYAFAEFEQEGEPEKKKVRRTLGQALMAWIADEAEHEERWIEALEKN